MLAFAQSYWRSLAGSLCCLAKARARHVGATFEPLESRCLLSIAPPTIPIIAADYRPAASSDDTGLWSGYSDAAPSRELPSPKIAEEEGVAAGRAGAGSYPSDGSLRPILPVPSMPDLPYDGGPAYEPPADSDSYSSLPGGPTPDDLIDITKSSEFQSTPLSVPEPPGQKSEASDVLDMLAALNYVPGRPQAKESASPGLSSPAASNAGKPRLSDALGATKNKDASIEDSVVLQRRPILAASAEEALSAAAIDALLEMPIKVDSTQSRFQAFEVSAGGDAPLPVLSTDGNRTTLEFQLPALDAAETGSDNSALFNGFMPPVVGQAAAVPAETIIDQSVSASAQQSEAVIGLEILDRRLDMITATLVATLIARAVLKLSTEGACAQENGSAKDQDRPILRREPMTRLNFESSVLDPRA